MEELIFILAFKGNQSIESVNKLKYKTAKKYQEQIIEYYKALENILTNIGT